MKRFLLATTVILIITDLAFWGYYFYNKNSALQNPLSAFTNRIQDRPLEKYSFDNLKERPSNPSKVTIGKQRVSEETTASYMFYYKTDGTKKVSGVLNVPKNAQNAPVIVMSRGFVNPSEYQPGIGTQNYARYLSNNGFITLAPDFLDHGESDHSNEIPLEGRFQTYTTLIDLLSSLDSLNDALHEIPKEDKIETTADTRRIGLWGHSNGGHISLAVLAITGKKYPTVLWNPVSKHFPYSVLFYTDEFDDQGKALRKVIADFENMYDIDLYSPANYYSWIQAPVQIHHGGSDYIVPEQWSRSLNDVLREKTVDVEFIVHPGGDHNMAGGTAWNDSAKMGMDFYLKQFSKEEKEDSKND